MKNRIDEIKSTVKGFTNRMDYTEDRILMLENKAEELSRLIINFKNTRKEQARSSGHHEKFSIDGQIKWRILWCKNRECFQKNH